MGRELKGTHDPSKREELQVFQRSQETLRLLLLSAQGCSVSAWGAGEVQFLPALGGKACSSWFCRLSHAKLCVFEEDAPSEVRGKVKSASGKNMMVCGLRYTIPAISQCHAEKFFCSGHFRFSKPLGQRKNVSNPEGGKERCLCPPILLFEGELSRAACLGGGVMPIRSLSGTHT